MIILVISMHAADTYSPLGNWYYVNRRPLSTTELLAFAFWQTYLQSFFMGLLFFIAGLFTPSSFDRKGARQFIRDRAFRLGIPVLLYTFCIGPLTEYYAAHSWTSTRATSFANEWIKHIDNGQFLQENGPLWFCLALLTFSLSYAILRTFPSPIHSNRSNLPAPGTKTLVGFAASMAIATFIVRAGRPAPVLNMRFGDFPSYVLLFGAGVMAARQRWLPKLSFSAGLRWMTVILPVGFAAWLLLLILGGALKGRGDDFSGGWYWQSAAFALWESFTCVAMCFGLLVLFREKFNAQGAIGRFLSNNAFSVYVFHPPILIVAARMLSGLPWEPIIKAVVLTILGVITSFTLSAAVFRRTPLLRNIL